VILVSLGRSSHRSAYAAAGALVLALLICFLLLPPVQTPEQQGYPDSKSYFAIASGNQQAAYYYYADRVLHPLTAALVARLFRLSLPDGFRAVACASLVLLFVMVAAEVGDPAFLGLLLIAVVVEAFRNYYLPDLFYAALLAIFFRCFLRNVWLALPILFLLQLSRESTIVLTGVIVALMLRRNRAFAWAVVLVGVGGMFATSLLMARGTPNHHGLSTLVFDFLKVAYNLSANLIGFVFWTDTNAATVGCSPVRTVAVHWGAIRHLGVCPYQWVRPLTTATSMASAFGLLPLLVWGARREKSPRTDLQTAFWYGLVSFIAAPLLGGTVERYTLYAWPLFWLYGGERLNSLHPHQKGTLVLFSLVASWTPRSLGPISAFFAAGLLYWCFWATTSLSSTLACEKTASAGG
jgi:hypothetical protein